MRIGRVVPSLLALASLLSASPATAQEPFSFTFSEPDSAAIREVVAHALAGRERIVSFFGHPFAEPVRVIVLPGREAFTAHLRRLWGFPETRCWMVGAAGRRELALLSPRVWISEACEHDPDDPDHVGDLIAHELVHAFHAQRNPSDEFAGMDDLGWLIEGLSTYVSGQLEAGQMERARQAVESGAGPATLAAAWSDEYRYGVAGSLVAFVDRTYGRERLFHLLGATTPEEVLASLRTDEAELLGAWRSWVRESGSRR